MHDFLVFFVCNTFILDALKKPWTVMSIAYRIVKYIFYIWQLQKMHANIPVTYNI